MAAIKRADRFADISAIEYFKVHDPGWVLWQREFPIGMKTEFEANPLGFVAKQAGVDEDDLLAYYDSDKNIRCCANTKAGRQCKWTKDGGLHVDIYEWLENRSWRCKAHEE